jgi:phosphatidylinositol 4-kinase A
MNARCKVCKEIKIDHPLFEVLLTSLLDTIISKGDAHESDNKRLNDVELAAQEIAQLLAPLATIISTNADGNDHDLGEAIVTLQRDAWFNVVVHGFSLTTPLGKKYSTELRTLAQYSQPLLAIERAEQLESDVELNTVLRRGKSADHADDQKKNLIKLLPTLESEIKSLNYQEAVFLNAVYLVEDLRASCGDCTKILTYFLDPKLRSGAIGDCMFAIAKAVVETYLERTVTGSLFAFSTPYLAQQLAVFLTGCCHRIQRVQQVAISCADKIIRTVPATLCQKTALFTLLELLSLMWWSCLEGDADEYEWKSTVTSTREHFTLDLSDNYDFRRVTLKNFHKCAKTWLLRVLDVAPLDIKGLLQVSLVVIGSGRRLIIYRHTYLNMTMKVLMAMFRWADLLLLRWVQRFLRLTSD